MAKNKKKKSLALILRNYFITGFVVLIPIGFTLYLSKILIGISSKLIPQNINPNYYLPYAIPGIEIIISLILITIVGGLSLSFLGKKQKFPHWGLFEKIRATKNPMAVPFLGGFDNDDPPYYAPQWPARV